MYDPVKTPELRQIRRKFSIWYNAVLIQEPAVAQIGSRLTVGDENLLTISLDVSSFFKVETNVPAEHFRFEIMAARPSCDRTWFAGEVLEIGYNPNSLEAGVRWIRRLGPLIVQAVFMEETIPLLDEGAVTRLLDNLACQFEARIEEIRREAEAVRQFYEVNRYRETVKANPVPA